MIIDTKKIKVTENDFKNFNNIATIPEHLEKSMVLYIRTWQEVPDDNQQENTMTTKPEWFNEFEDNQEQRWKEQQEFNQKVVKFMSDQDKRWKEQQGFNKKQHEFNQRILSLVESLVERVESIEHRLDKLESRIDNLVVKNNLKE